MASRKWAVPVDRCLTPRLARESQRGIRICKVPFYTLHLFPHDSVFIPQLVIGTLPEISLNEPKHLILIQTLHTYIAFIFFIIFIIHTALTIRDLVFSTFHKFTLPSLFQNFFRVKSISHTSILHSFVSLSSISR